MNQIINNKSMYNIKQLLWLIDFYITKIFLFKSHLFFLMFSFSVLCIVSDLYILHVESSEMILSETKYSVPNVLPEVESTKIDSSPISEKSSNQIDPVDRRLEGLLLFFGSAIIWTGYVWIYGITTAVVSKSSTPEITSPVVEVPLLNSSSIISSTPEITSPVVEVQGSIHSVSSEGSMGSTESSSSGSIGVMTPERSDEVDSIFFREIQEKDILYDRDLYPYFWENLMDLRSIYDGIQSQMLENLLNKNPDVLPTQITDNFELISARFFTDNWDVIFDELNLRLADSNMDLLYQRILDLI